jgi:hypothetical protein
MSLNLNQYANFISDATKSSLLLDLLEKSPNLAIQAIDELLVDNSTEQEYIQIFSKNYLKYIENKDNKDINQEFHQCYLNKLKHSFSILCNTKPDITYHHFYIQYGINSKIIYDVNFLVNLTHVKPFEQTDWLTQIIRQISSMKLKDALMLSDESKNLIAKHFNHFMPKTQLSYIAYTDIYPTIKPMLSHDFFKINNELLLEEMTENIKDSEVNLKSQIVLLSLKLSLLPFELLEDIILSTQEKNLPQIKKVVLEALSDSVDECDKSLFIFNDLILQKLEFLENKIDFNHINFCKNHLSGMLYKLFDYTIKAHESNYNEKTTKLAMNFFKYINAKKPPSTIFFDEKDLIHNFDVMMGVSQSFKGTQAFVIEYLKMSSLSLNTTNTSESDLIIKYIKLIHDNPQDALKHFSLHLANCENMTEQEAIEKGLINLEKMVLDMNLKVSNNRAKKLKV